MNRRRFSVWRRALRRASPWLWGGAAVLLVLAAYVGAWRPARTALARHAAYPLLAAAAPPEASGEAVQLAGGGEVVRAAPAREEGAAPLSFRAPAGVRFLVPGLFLAAAFPRRSYWLVLWGLHVAAGAVALAVLAGAVRWGAGAGVYHFWTGLGRDVFSLLVPLWMGLRAHWGRFLPPPENGDAPPAS